MTTIFIAAPFVHQAIAPEFDEHTVPATQLEGFAGALNYASV
jgi:hypothetical protein